MKIMITTPCLLGASILGACERAGTNAAPAEHALVASAEQEDVRIEIHAGSTRAEAGEPIELILTLEAPPSRRAELHLPDDGRLGVFDVLRVEDDRTGLNDLKIAEKRRLLLSTLESGSVELPSIEAHYGTDSILRTNPAEFTIDSLIEGEFDPASFADIRPAVDDMLDSERPDWIIPTAVGGAALIAIALAIAFALAFRKRLPPRVPHEWALAELDRIEAEGPPREERTTERYERIENIVRWYVAFRFAIDAPDRTSNELLDAIQDHHDVSDDARVILERIVRESDRVKFAGGVVSPEDCRIAVGSARLFVQQTIARETEEAA